MHTNPTSNSVNVSNSYILWDFKSCEKAMSWCTAQCKMLLFCLKTIVKVKQFWTMQPILRRRRRITRRKKERKTFLAVWWLSGLALLWCFFVPLGILLVMKTLEDEWYIVIKFTVFVLSCIYCVSMLSLHKSLLTIWYHWLFWPQKLLPWLQTSRRDSSDKWFIWYGLSETTCEESVQDVILQKFKVQFRW